MKRKILTTLVAGALTWGVVDFAMARTGDKSIEQVQVSSVPKEVQDTFTRSSVGSDAGEIYVVDRADGKEYAATFERDGEPWVLRIDAAGSVVEEARPQSESDRKFLATATVAKDAVKKDADATEAQLAAAMVQADARTPVSQDDLPEPVKTATADALKGASSIGTYKIGEDDYLIHYQAADGKMMETTIDSDGAVVQEARERKILKAALPIKKEAIPAAVQTSIDEAMAGAKVKSPANVRYYRVGEDDYAVQFMNDKGRQMGLRVDKDGSIVNELHETKKQPNEKKAAGKAAASQ